MLEVDCIPRLLKGYAFIQVCLPSHEFYCKGITALLAVSFGFPDIKKLDMKVSDLAAPVKKMIDKQQFKPAIV